MAGGGGIAVPLVAWVCVLPQHQQLDVGVLVHGQWTLQQRSHFHDIIQGAVHLEKWGSREKDASERGYLKRIVAKRAFARGHLLLRHQRFNNRPFIADYPAFSAIHWWGPRQLQNRGKWVTSHASLDAHLRASNIVTALR